MEDSRTKTLEELKKADRRIWFLYGVYGFFLIVVLVLLFFKANPAIFLGIAVFTFYFLIVRGELKNYQERVIRENIRWTVRGGRGRAEKCTHPFDSSELSKCGLIPVAGGENALLARHGLRISDDISSLICAEVTFHYGGKEKNKLGYRFVNGTLLRSEFAGKELKTDFLILESAFLEEKAARDFYFSAGYRFSENIPDSLRDKNLTILVRNGNRFPFSLETAVYRLSCEAVTPFLLQISGGTVTLLLIERFYFEPFSFTETLTEAVLRNAVLTEGQAFQKICEMVSEFRFER